MSWKPETFTKSSGFEIQDGSYRITQSRFVVPNPTSEDPEKQKKIDQIKPMCIWRHTLLEVDENNDVIDATKPKQLDLKFGELDKVRPSDELSNDIADGDATKGFEGRYAVPSSYSPHENSKAGFFVNSLVNVANFPSERIPDDNDATFLEGFVVRIRPKAQPGVKGADGRTGEPWNQYEVYQIIYDPASKPKSGGKSAAKPATTAAKPATSAKSKPAPEPVVESPEETDTNDADNGDEFDAQAATVQLILATIKDLKNKKKNVTFQSVKLGVVAKFSTLPADQQKEIKPLANSQDFIQTVIDSAE